MHCCGQSQQQNVFCECDCYIFDFSLLNFVVRQPFLWFVSLWVFVSAAVWANCDLNLSEWHVDRWWDALRPHYGLLQGAQEAPTQVKHSASSVCVCLCVCQRAILVANVNGRLCLYWATVACVEYWSLKK